LLKEFHVKEPPVPVLDIAEKVARVRYFHDKDLREGYAFYWPRWDVHYICLNLVYPSQMELVCAYLLAHVVLGHYKNPATLWSELLLQKEDADIFVRVFLMPKELVFRYVGFPLGNTPERRLRELQAAFKVPWDLFMKRLHELEKASGKVDSLRPNYPPGRLYRIK
jgi:Zn-dependent peptidase ImmA (M78 family)